MEAEKLIIKAENDILDIINKLESSTKKNIDDIYIHISPYIKTEERCISKISIEFFDSD